MPLEELIIHFLLANASLNKISFLVTGACQSLVHFSFTHPFYVRTVYKRHPARTCSDGDGGTFYLQITRTHRLGGEASSGLKTGDGGRCWRYEALVSCNVCYR